MMLFCGRGFEKDFKNYIVVFFWRLSRWRLVVV